nr:temperature-induced lipocalin-1-like [Ipomoea batatas]
MEVVRNLDVERYMGRWYEIASFPSRFQPKDGVDTRATYTLNPDGTVHVLNETWSGGKRGFIEGTAYKADPKSDEAKLKDYQYALIGQPSRNYLWILCRQPRLDDEIYNQLLERAKDEGYDVSKLHKTLHSETPPEGEVASDKGIWWLKSIFGK